MLSIPTVFLAQCLLSFSYHHHHLLQIKKYVGRVGTWRSIGALIEIIERIPARHAPRQEIDNIARRCVKIVTDSRVAREQGMTPGLTLIKMKT